MVIRVKYICCCHEPWALKALKVLQYPNWDQRSHHWLSSWPPSVSRSSPAGWTVCGSPSPWCWSPACSLLSAVYGSRLVCHPGNCLGAAAQSVACCGGVAVGILALLAPHQKTPSRLARCLSVCRLRVRCLLEPPPQNCHFLQLLLHKNTGNSEIV